MTFAMSLTNPSPVCVLDKGDVPLDDANIDRFRLLVNQIADEVGTRFLIITHHRLTWREWTGSMGDDGGARGVAAGSVDLRRADELTAA